MNILKTIKVIGLVVVFALGPSFIWQATAQPGISVPVQTFYNELSPYGQWLPSPNYGSVWVPNVGPDFQPYASNGHWVITEFGNTWVSDYAWGWAPFHYGRWYFDNQYGWSWVPGSDWGPAWVSWRTGGGYYGWAPLGPGFDITINVNIPAPYWTFVPQIYITSPNLYSYRVARPNVVNIYQNTTIINNVYRSNNRAYVYGPPRGDIERITRQNVPIYRIDPMDRPGRSVVGNGSVGFYRPGQSAGYGQGYGRNDRFDNSPRTNYSDSRELNRGYEGNRGRYNDNTDNNSMPNRNYEGRTNNTPNRGNYGGNYPADRDGGYGNPSTPNPGSTDRAQSPSDRFESGRGSYSPASPQPQGNYSPGRVPQGSNAQQPTRSYERVERVGQMNSQPMPGGHSEGSFHRTPDSRAMQPQNQPQQRSQEQSQRSTNGYNPGGRGPHSM